MDIYHTLARFMQEGGFFMYPILLVLALGVAIAVERFFYLRNVKKSNVQVWNRVLPLIQNGQYREAMSAANESDAAVSKILSYDPSQKAELLSASTSEAMNCTAFGLGAAIPMMLIYSFLQSKTTELVDSLEMVAVKFLNLLQEQIPQEAAR